MSNDKKDSNKKNMKSRTGTTGGAKKKQNPNLRLIKNGDLKTEKEEPKKKKTASVNTKDKKKATDGKKAVSGKKSMNVRKSAGGGRIGSGPDISEWFAQHRSLVIIGCTVFLLAALLFAGYYYIVSTYTVTTVYVDGNVHYTSEEVMDMVMKGRYGNNSLYLAAKYKDKGVEGVPFVEKMDVNILSPDTIRINVYEKALAGYVEYLGRYMYFDKDGIVVESSSVKTTGIPQVTGLTFNFVVLNEPLPVENDEIFKKILNITQLLTKYDLTADKIFFDSAYEVTLYFGDVRATLGSSEELDDKIMKLPYILPQLEGKKGTLRMESYTEDAKNIPFNQD